MKSKYYNINQDIIEKIDNLEIKNSKKDFIKDALVLEYANRENNASLKKFYVELVKKYFEK